MDAFSYLSVLLSIILGLAITQVLQGVRGLLLSRRRVVTYLPTLFWAALLLVFATQSWWASFGLTTHRTWTFAAFGMILIQTILLYMLAALVLPDFARDEPNDLKAHYYREAGPFFGIMVAMIVASFLKDLVLDGRPPTGANLIFHLCFVALSLPAALFRNNRLHEAITVAWAVLITVYIALLFATLG